jgi:hypothetical protein
MTHTSGPSRFLDLSGIDQLPVWAQVTLAARLARRMTLGWRNLTEPQRQPMLHACDRMLAAATTGQCKAEDRAAFTSACDHATALKADALALTLFYAGDAAFAAMRADETSWGDATVVASTRKALQAACSAAQFGHWQVRIAIAADADQLAFACSEQSLGRLDVMTPHVFGRLMPANALTPAFEEPVNIQDLYR